ncbi:MAG: protease family protein [Clostridiales bacterium]|nr:protease family protein [Clostridiales bacterium]
MEGNAAKRPTVLGVNILFLIVVILFFTVGAMAQQYDIYTGLLITEFGIILASSLIYMAWQRMPVKYVVRLNPITLRQVVLVVLVAASGYGVVTFLSLIWMYVLDLAGQLLPQPVPVIDTGGAYLRALAIIAGSAAICEETLFRGVILRGYEVYGARKAVIYSGILFGLMHANIQNFIGPIFLGITIGYMVYITDSIFAGMIAHFINNAVAVTLSYIATVLAEAMGQEEMAQSLAELPASQLWVTMGVYAVIGFASLALFIWFLNMLKDTTSNKSTHIPADEDIKHPKFVHFIPLIIGIIFIAAELVLQLMIILGIIDLNSVL